MRYPWVNVALLALLVFQLATGLLGLVGGSPAFQFILRLHAWGGYAIAALLAWKGIIIFDAFNRLRRFGVARLAFLLLAFLLLLILATGIIWPLSGYASLGGFSLMTIHALSGLALLGLLVWHTLARRYVFKSRRVSGRRAFLHYAAFAVGGFAVWQFTEWAQSVLKLPGLARRFTGSYETGSRTDTFPTVSWILDNPAPIARESWHLTVDGAVEHPYTLTYAELTQLATDSIEQTLDCTGGWYSTQEWNGVRLERLLRIARVRQSARSVTVESISGYTRRFSLQEVPACLLALTVAGETLDHGHGFPLRLVAPGHRGFDWVKWVVAVHLNETSALLQPPLPLQ